MEVYLNFQELQLDRFPNGRNRLSALFKDRQTETIYRWVPRWKDVEELFFQSSLIEALNKEDSPYLIRFAESAKVVIKMEPERPKLKRTPFRVRSAELDVVLHAKDRDEALNNGLRQAARSNKTLGRLTTTAEIVGNVELHEVYHDTIRHLKALGLYEEKSDT